MRKVWCINKWWFTIITHFFLHDNIIVQSLFSLRSQGSWLLQGLIHEQSSFRLPILNVDIFDRMMNSNFSVDILQLRACSTVFSIRLHSIHSFFVAFHSFCITKLDAITIKLCIVHVHSIYGQILDRALFWSLRFEAPKHIQKYYFVHSKLGIGQTFKKCE